MKNIAVITEFNPFHLGHAKLARKLREREGDACICAIMSDCFTQRGTPALFDGYFRAEAAVKGGYDLVLSLPYPCSASSAEFFALGGVGIARGCGIFDSLAFGYDCEDEKELFSAAEVLASEEYKNALLSKTGGEERYAERAGEIYREITGSVLPGGPNDILATEYIKALFADGGKISPLPVKREEDSLTAHGAREKILSGDFAGAEALCGYADFPETTDEKKINQYIYNLYKVNPLSVNEGSAFCEGGLVNRFRKAAEQAKDEEEFFSLCLTKKYTNSRIKRALLASTLGADGQSVKSAPAFTEALAFNDRGREMIRRIKKEGSISLLSRPAEGADLPGFEINTRAKRLFSLGREKEYDIFSGTPVYINEQGDKK